jgi:uncharacterized iron-regulated membrane protein
VRFSCSIQMRVVKPGQRLRAVLLKVHRVGGLVAALPLLVLAVTGCVMAFESQIDALLHPSLFRVIPQGQALALSAMLPRVQGELGDLEHVQIAIVSAEPTHSYCFTVLGGGRVPRQIFVDPYSGRILGAMSVARFVLIMHALHQANGILMGVSSLVLAVSVLSGLYLWWPLKRIKLSGYRTRRRFYFDLHNSIGVSSSLFLLVFALTGTFMAFEQWTVPVTYRLTGARPPQDDPTSFPQEEVGTVSADFALEVARGALKDAVPLWVVLPQAATSSYLVKMRFPEDREPNGTSIVWVDRYSGKVLEVWDSRTAPVARRVQSFNRVMHSGDVLGYPGKVIACGMSVALMVQTVTGIWLWRKRRAQGIGSGRRELA